MPGASKAVPVTRLSVACPTALTALIANGLGPGRPWLHRAGHGQNHIGGQASRAHAEAIVSCRGRLVCVDADLSTLAPGSDADSAARAEREWLVAQLASAAGLGHRPRSFPDDAGRARAAVGKAIRRVLARITAAEVVIGEHLRQAIRTGTRCSYWPS